MTNSIKHVLKVIYEIETYDEYLYVPKLRALLSRSLLAAVAPRSTLEGTFASPNPRYSTQLQDEAEQQRYRAD